MREAVITLTDEEVEAMGFGELVSICREAGVRDVELLEDDGRGGVSQIEVDSKLPADRLDDIESVDGWELVGESSDGYVYVLDVTALDFPEQAAIDHEDLVGACDPTVADRGLLLSLVGSQESIRAMLRNFEDAGIAPDLHRLAEYEGGQRALDSLTDRQLEVLQTAYDMGFYEVPREATVEEIADEIGVDGGTVSEHLQRAERNLLSQQLAARA